MLLIPHPRGALGVIASRASLFAWMAAVLQLATGSLYSGKRAHGWLRSMQKPFRLLSFLDPRKREGLAQREKNHSSSDASGGQGGENGTALRDPLSPPWTHPIHPR